MFDVMRECVAAFIVEGEKVLLGKRSATRCFTRMFGTFSAVIKIRANRAKTLCGASCAKNSESCRHGGDSC